MSVFTNEDVVSVVGTVTVDGSGVTQPVSGTVNVGNFPATQNVAVTSSVEVEVKNDTGNPVPINGTVTANAGTGPFPVSDNGGSLTVDGTVAISGSVAVTGPLTDTQLRATPVPVTSGSLSTAVVTSVSVSPTVATVLTSVSTRVKFVLYNETGTLFVKLGSGASSSDYSMKLTASSSWEFSGYSGVVTAIKQSGTSNLLVTAVQ